MLRRILGWFIQRVDVLVLLAGLGLIFIGILSFSAPVALIVLGSLLVLDVYMGRQRRGK